MSESKQIPFKTLDNYASSGGKTKVIQEGKEGLKEITYKISYKNGVEISREEISTKTIKDPVNKIIARYVKIQDRKTEKRLVEDKNDPIYEYTERDKWFVKTDLGVEYFYSSREALDRHIELGKKGHPGNWGTAEPEVTETLVGYGSKEEVVVIQEEVWDWKY
ncbi:MAG: G5 domain-containing protein [Tissierellia bacterium]|nr:G5 domain-containing protein [Tissierellia bacterium]